MPIVKIIFIALFCFISWIPATSGYALEPSEVLVIANRFVPGSVSLAEYYMEQRGIPKQNLLRITTTEKENCSRAIYDKEIAAPVLRFLRQPEHAGKIRAFVTMRGVPLRVAAPELTGAEKKQLQQLQKERDSLRRQRQNEELDDADLAAIKGELAAIDAQIKRLRNQDASAAVDSELSLVLAADYDLKFWQPNPFFIGFQNQPLTITKDQVLLGSRLDAPTVELVRRMIDDSLAAEAQGLAGTAYFDARWSRSSKGNLKGYALYDQSLHLAAERVRARGIMPVVVEETSALLQPGEAPDTALYGGWYSLARYVPAFEWVPGAIGFHIASQECQSLRAGTSQFWCKRMLEEGAAAVVGPVGEPYVQSFPVPELFFGLLVDGSYSLAEAYILSLPYLSWRMVLVGDPLYRPFRAFLTNDK